MSIRNATVTFAGLAILAIIAGCTAHRGVYTPGRPEVILDGTTYGRHTLDQVDGETVYVESRSLGQGKGLGDLLRGEKSGHQAWAQELAPDWDYKGVQVLDGTLVVLYYEGIFQKTPGTWDFQKIWEANGRTGHTVRFETIGEETVLLTENQVLGWESGKISDPPLFQLSMFEFMDGHRELLRCDKGIRGVHDIFLVVHDDGNHRVEGVLVLRPGLKKYWKYQQEPALWNPPYCAVRPDGIVQLSGWAHHVKWAVTLDPEGGEGFSEAKAQETAERE